MHKISFLTYAQQGVYIDCILDPENLRYNNPQAIHFPHSVSAEAIAEACKKVLECHPALFSHFEDRNGNATQVYADQCHAEVTIRRIDDNDIETIKDSFIRVFDIEHGPLYRAEVLDAPSGVTLLLDFHHLVYDGASLNILLNEICTALEGIEPMAESHTYIDFAKAQQEDKTDHKSYYDQLLGNGITSTQIPTDLNGTEGCHKEHVQFVSIQDVMSKAKALNTAPSALFMAAAFYTLSRYTNTKELCMTTISNGRLNPLTEGVVGMFVNTIPLVCKIEDVSTLAFIHDIRSMFQETRKHEEYPFAALVNDYGIEQNVRFTYQYGTFGNTFHINGEDVKAESMRTNSHTFPFTITIARIDDKPAIVINYDTAKYSADFASRFAESMDAVVSHFLENPESKLLSTSIMSERQKTEVAELRQTCLDSSAVRFPLFHNSVEYWAEKTPNNTAIIACNETLTYRQFNEKANILAHALIENGVVSGDRICLLLPRKSWHLIAMFGVMKTGAAYIPCDPEYPAERIKLITEDSHARYVITTKEKMADYGNRALDIEELLVSNVNNIENPNIKQDSDSLAYLIYTSGSTGRPKGVMLRHIGICNYLTDHVENRHINAFVNECKSMMGITTVSFDLSLKELGATIYNGKTLVFANEEETMSPILLSELYKRTGCDGFNGTPSRLKSFLELTEFQNVVKDLKVIILGGEKYPTTLIPQLRSLTKARLFNTYGPTEITVSSNVCELTHENKVTVGEPLLNYHEYIVDADDNELPVGVVGELLVGGIGVGRGYNDLPEKTSEAFVKYQNQRVYRTGDYACWMANGKVEILGRKDHQIKLNGLRIELGEVETVLNKQPQVKEGVAMIKSVDGHDHLVAYYTLKENVKNEFSDTKTLETILKEQMGKSLTHYMIPSIFVQLEKMPISPNGKTDLKALPQPVITISEEDKVLPTTKEEQALYDIVAEIVGNTNFGITSNLISVGLTSLLAIRLSVFVSGKMNATLSVRDILRYPTIKELATKLQGTQEPSENQNIKISSAPLSFSQRGIYAECISNPDDIQYNIPVCLTMPQGINTQQVKEALHKIFDAHPHLYTHFQTDENGDVYQCLMENKNIDCSVITMTEQELEQEKKEFVRPFALQEGPLCRFEIVECASSVYLLADFHHLVMDGGSLDIFYNQLCQTFDGQPLEKEKYDYYQFVTNQKIEPSTEQFFAEQLNQIEEASALLPDRYDNDDSHQQAKVKIPTDLQTVQNKCKQLNITPASLYLAAVTIAINKYTTEDIVGLCTVSNGRSNLQISNTFGMFVNTLPLISKVDTSLSVNNYLQRVADTFLETLANEDYPYSKIVEKYGYTANIMYAYQVGVLNKYRCNNGELKIQKLELQKAKFPLSVLIEGNVVDGGIINVQYDASLFSESMMKGFADAVQHIVTELLVCENMSDVTICNEQMITLLDSFNAKSNPVSAEEDSDQTVLSLFQRIAKQYPNNVAAVFKDKKYTYKELDELSSKIGGLIYSKIKDCGKTEPVVSILIPRNEYIFILPLATMKAGCAYQPLDPSYPQERLNFMVKDADAALLITDDEHRPIINEYEGQVVVTSELENIEQQETPICNLTPQSLFILLYTSGSTGVPKGVMLEHQNLIAFIKYYRRYYDLKPEHNVAAYASFGFDANMMDLYPALTTGATIHIIAEEIRLDLVALNEYFEKNNITHSFITTQVGVQFLLNTENHSLKHLSVGGEKLISVEPAQGYTFHNLYGPTECTIFATNTPVLKKESNIPIGKPTDLLDCYVMDKNLHRLPVGAAGELIIVGKQVGRGYLNRPDKTAEAFFTMNGERAYHSGDIVRYRQDGNIEFVGRKDGQVKIRGFRIELKEIESVIRDFNGISDVTVQAFDDPNGGKFVAAYVVSADEVNIDALNAFILDQKPPYMVPAVTMQIEKIPLNVNQKVDKKALPKPEPKSKGTGSDIASAAPLNALEKELKAIIASVVNTEDFSITDVLGYVGLTSISSIKLATLIYKKFGVQVNSKTLAKTGSLQSIENEILALWMNGGAKPSADEQESGKTTNSKESKISNNFAPLTYPQIGVYLDCLKFHNSTLYNIPLVLNLSKSIPVEELQNAVKATIENHQSFWLTFETIDGEMRQILNNHISFDIPITELSESEIDSYEKSFIRPFDLAKGPLFRFEIVKTESYTHLFMDTHHLISDGGSIDLITKEIANRLNGTKIETENYSYIQFAEEQKAAKDGEEYLSAKSFFDSRLACCESASEITADLPKNDDANHTIGKSVCAVDMSHVEHLAKQIGVTPMSVFLAAAYYTVSRFVNNKQVYLGTISNGRSNLRIYNTTGMFVNTLALSSNINDQSVSEFIQETDKNFTDTLSHEQYPFSQIAADYGFKPEIVFEYQVGVLDNNIVHGEKATLKGLSLDLAKFKMKIVINNSTNGGHEITIGYDKALYSPELANNFAEAYKTAIENFTSQPNEFVKKISIMSDTQKKKIETLRTTALANVPFKRFYEPIEYWAEKTPDALAVYACDRQLTFKEFNAECNRVAHALIAKGVKRGDKVVLLLPRTSQVLCCIFGVSKAGAAYIPCDPAYPAERISLITDDSKATFVITTKEHLSEHKDNAILVDDLFTYNADNYASNPNVFVSPDDLVYLIYTSGSTGRPKGVMLRHEGICSYLYDHPANAHIHSLKTEDVRAYICITTLSFDMSLKEYGVALHNGITAVLASEDEVNNPILLAELFRKTGAQAINGTPSRLLNCMESEDFCKALSQCKVIMSGGEKYSDKLLERLHEMNLRIFNTYGPTEITVSSNCAELTKTNQITIGLPLLNYTEFVVDSDGNELPIGVVGELYIGGPGVARGYNNLPEQTAERFIDYQGIRVYRSGDYARWLPDGRVDVLGRLDNQVKLNGLRIELGEVESAISKVEGVKQTVVMIRNIDGRDHLSAYYVADHPIDIEDMKSQIGTTLTHYMVPTAYLQMDKFPLTPNGKTDVKHLPEPQLSKVGGDYVAPKNKIEEDFCHAFENILNLEKVSAADSFFDLGGTSLTATRVIIEAKNYGYNITYAEVFSHPTAQKLAKLVGGVSEESVDTEITDYDYSKIDELLAANNLDSFRKGERLRLGNVLLTGANGFLGIHILHNLLENHIKQHPQYKVYCLVRHGKNGVSSEARLQDLLFYYFEKSYKDLFGNQLIVIDGDVTNQEAFNQVSSQKVDDIPLTVINCAAIVKHFSEGTEIEDINIGGLQNCVDFCLKTGSRLIQTSTNSTGGLSMNGYPNPKTDYREQTHYFGQTLNSKYTHSKFLAERIVLESIIEKGLVAKVVRLGNLAPRATDGEFQINFRSNSAMGRLHIFQMLGVCSYSLAVGKVEFSPIDEVAEAILLLATTPKECCVFHPFNDHMVKLGDVIREIANTLNVKIEEVEDDVFNNILNEAAQDPEKAKVLQSMLAYKTDSKVKVTGFAKYNPYTIHVLARLGFHWNVTSWDYVQRFLKAIAMLDFFEDKR